MEQVEAHVILTILYEPSSPVSNDFQCWLLELLRVVPMRVGQTFKQSNCMG
jgi:hypothetical protein